VTVSGTGEAGTMVQLLDGATAIGSAVTVSVGGTWTEQVTLTGGSSHTIRAELADISCGSRSRYPRPHTVSM
jgi:hypothetical protein